MIPARSDLQDADTAMYQAKKKGGDQHSIFDLRDRQPPDRRASLQGQLTKALARTAAPSYQPIVCTCDGHVVGVEALLRWADPSRGSLAR